MFSVKRNVKMDLLGQWYENKYGVKLSFKINLGKNRNGEGYMI